MRHLVLFVAAIASAAWCLAAEERWVGGSSGYFTNELNWASGAVPGNSATLVFDVDYDVFVDLSGSLQTIYSGFKVLRNNVVISKDIVKNHNKYMNRTLTFDVAQGSSLVISNGFYCYYGGVNRVVKTGEGEFHLVTGGLGGGGTAYTLLVEQGDFYMEDPTSVKPTCSISTNIVSSGARCHFSGPIYTSQGPVTFLNGDAELYVSNGCTYSACWLAGSGSVIAGSSADVISITQAKPSDDVFTGVFRGNPTIQLSDGAAAGTRPRFVVQGSRQLDSASVATIRSPGGLAFKAGIGTFYLASLNGYYGKKGALILEDEDGEPVTVYAGMANADGVEVAGSGNLFITNSVTGLPAANYTATGIVGTTDSGTFYFKSGFDLTRAGATISSVRPEGGIIRFANGTDVEVPVRGEFNRLELSDASKRITDLDVVVNNLKLIGNGYKYEFSNSTAIVKTSVGVDTGRAVTNVFSGLYLCSTQEVCTWDSGTSIKRPRCVEFSESDACSNFELRDGELYFGGGWGVCGLILTGGKIHFPQAFSLNPNGVGANICFDGSEVVLELSSGSYDFQYASAAYNRTVGANGARISIGRVCRTTVPGVQFHNQWTTDPSVVQDGGITLYGRAAWKFDKALAINGPVSVMDGTIRPATSAAEMSADIYGTGDFRLRDAFLNVADQLTAGYSANISIASGEGSAFIYEGSSRVLMRSVAANAYQHITVGALQRAGKGSMLTIDELTGSSAMIGVEDGDSFKVNGMAASSFVRDPIIIADANGSVKNFAKYDSTYGFRPMADEDYVNGFATADENSVVYLTESVSPSADIACAALKINSWGYVRPAAGVHVRIGNGTDPAMVMFRTGGGFGGAGYIDFGTSEGILVAGNSDGDVGHRIIGAMAGSGGVSYMGVPGSSVNRKFIVASTNVYTGGTHVRCCEVMPRTDGCFSSGEVYVGSGKYFGGTLVFDNEITLANNFRVAGWGYKTGDGLFKFNSSSTISGNVEIEEPVRVAAAGGATGTFSGRISGDQLVVYGDTTAAERGLVRLTGENTYTGGTEVVRANLAISNAKALGRGTLLLDGGVLVCENSSDMIISNRIEGVGTVRLAGRGKVTFVDLASQDDAGFALDLATRKPRIESLAGFSSITTSRSSKVSLIDMGDADGYWTGSVPENVTLYYGTEPESDGLILIVE